MSIQTKKLGKLEYLSAEGITVPHCFTTRYGGVSTGALASLNLTIKLDETDANVRANFEILGKALGFEISDLVLTRQIHSDTVRKVGREDCRGCFERDYPQCDGLITCEENVALTIFTADCTPLLFHDPVTGAVGAAHAGWRGTASAIGPKTVAAMVREYGCDPADIRAAIGPNIGFRRFETDADVPQALLEAHGPEISPFIRKTKNKYYVNLKEINALILRRAGVRHIEISEACTMCQPHRFWSHRVTGGVRGAQGAIIVCKEAQK